jgi:hypothetical protein
MKICSKCFSEFNEREGADYNLALELGDIFMEHTIESNGSDLCPECREEFGMLNLIGFGK